MLRLQAGDKSGDVILTLREYPRLWRDRYFCLALGVAVGLHLVALVILSVSELAIRDTPSFIQPAVVQTDISSAEATAATAQLGPEYRHALGWAPPRTALPAMPVLGMDIAYQRLRPMTDSPQADPFGLLVANHVLEPMMPASPILQLALSGLVADEEVLGPIGNTSFPIPEGTRWRYAVRLDQRHGRILWLKTLDAPRDQALADRGEALVRNLRFKTKRHGIIIPGNIELWMK